MASVQPIIIKLDNFGCNLNFSNNAPKTSRALEAIGAPLPLNVFFNFPHNRYIIAALKGNEIATWLERYKKYIPSHLDNITPT